jgi:hypothetical protein
MFSMILQLGGLATLIDGIIAAAAASSIKSEDKDSKFHF